MAITTMSQVLTGLPGQEAEGIKAQLNPSAAGWASYWQSTGWPGAGAAPTSGLAGDVPTSATAGALPLRNAASGGLYLASAFLSLGGSSSGLANFYLYDRLWHNSGISATSTGAQTVNSTALTRPDANADGKAELWWQVYVVMGAATPGITVTYTNPAGTGSRSAISGVMPSAPVQGRTGPFYLHAADIGVKSIQTYQADASYLSGTIGLVLRRRISSFSLRSAVDFAALDAIATGLPRIYDGSCLELLAWGGASVNTLPMFSLNIIEG